MACNYLFADDMERSVADVVRVFHQTIWYVEPGIRCTISNASPVWYVGSNFQLVKNSTSWTKTNSSAKKII